MMFNWPINDRPSSSRYSQSTILIVNLLFIVFALLLLLSGVILGSIIDAFGVPEADLKFRVLDIYIPYHIHACGYILSGMIRGGSYLIGVIIDGAVNASIMLLIDLYKRAMTFFILLNHLWMNFETLSLIISESIDEQLPQIENKNCTLCEDFERVYESIKIWFGGITLEGLECNFKWILEVIKAEMSIWYSNKLEAYEFTKLVFKRLYLVWKDWFITEIENFLFSSSATFSHLKVDGRQHLFKTIRSALPYIYSLLIWSYVASLWLYLAKVLYYTIFRNVNYDSVSSTVTSVLFFQWVLVALSLILYKESVTIGSSMTINGVLIPTTILSFYFDKLTLSFLFTIYVISYIVSLYQFKYLIDNPQKERFFLVFNIFILSMVFVVITSNWVILLLSWEILGLSSFFLIGFYKNKPSALKSALKAFLFNKMSDLFLIVAFMWYYVSYNTIYFAESYTVNLSTQWIGVFLLITAFIKSAQFIFYFWLPDSMEAPIPASALIHSATLVSAGIYLVLRFITFIEVSAVSQNLLLVVSTVTMVFASLIAHNQTDIKKLLAYSTISNCAFIYFLIYVKCYNLAIVYFIIHGLLKSFSFVIAGVLIVSNDHSQDIRKWNNFNHAETLLMVALIFIFLWLGGTPLAIVYNLKSTIFTSNYLNSWVFYYVMLVLVIYTVSSYFYSLKLLLFILNRKTLFRGKKTFSPYDYENDATILVSFIGYLFIIVLVAIAGVLLLNTNEPLWNFSWVIGIMVLTYVILYINLAGLHVFNLTFGLAFLVYYGAI